MTWSGKPWLRVTSATQFRIPLPSVLPQRLTIEFDAVVPWNGLVVSTEYVKVEADQQVSAGPQGN
ncbi:MAG: hypothetical protein H0W68_05800 [Gemmatimonadaceae bacterium]|nr:hypothetical protein [Geodermatophilaceae bacterium]MBA3671521.1 hypothetical protein [Gemmatimonadaceae bacterium]